MSMSDDMYMRRVSAGVGTPPLPGQMLSYLLSTIIIYDSLLYYLSTESTMIALLSHEVAYLPSPQTLSYVLSLL